MKGDKTKSDIKNGREAKSNVNRKCLRGPRNNELADMAVSRKNIVGNQRAMRIMTPNCLINFYK